MPTGHQPHVHTAHTASHRRRLSHHARSNSSTSLSSMGAGGKGSGRSAGLGMTATATAASDDRPGRRRKSGGEAVLKPSPSQTDLRARSSSSSHRSRSSHRRSSSSQRTASHQRASSAHRASVTSQTDDAPSLSHDEPPSAERDADDADDEIMSSSAVTKVNSIEPDRLPVSPGPEPVGRSPSAELSLPSPTAEPVPEPTPSSPSPPSHSPLSPPAADQSAPLEASQPLPSPFAEDSTSSSPPADGPISSPPATESAAAPMPVVALSPSSPAVLPEQSPVASPAPISQPVVESPPSLEPVPSPSRPGKEPARAARYPNQLRKASSKSSLLSLVTRPNLLPKRLSSLSAHPSLAAAPQISTEAALSSPTISRGSEGLDLTDGNDERTAAGHLRKASFGSFSSAAPPRGRTPSVAGSIRSDRGGVLGHTVGGGGGSAVDSLTALRSAAGAPNKGRPESGMPRRRIASSASSTSLADLAEGVKRSVFSSFYHGSSSGHPNRAATSPDDATTSAAASRPSHTPKPPPLVKSHFIRPPPSASALPKNPVLHPSPFLDAHTSLLRGMQAPGRDGQTPAAVDGGRTPMGMSIRRCLLLAGDAGPPNGSAHSAGARRSAGTSIVSAR